MDKRRKLILRYQKWMRLYNKLAETEHNINQLLKQLQ